MKTPRIGVMSPEEIMTKRAFRRTLPSDSLIPGGSQYRTGGEGSLDTSAGPLRYEILTQADFMREYDVNSHKINSLKYYPNPFSKDESNRYRQKIKSRIAVAFQERIFIKRLTTLIGNSVNFRIANAKASAADQSTLAAFREGWQMKNMENAIYEAIASDGKTGDCALVFWLSGGRMGWRSFSFEKGDILYPHYDPMTGELALFGRRYFADDTEYLDVWDGDGYCRYRRDSGNGASGSWAVDQERVPHNYGRVPVAYDRYGGPFWANSQSLIDAYEAAISQLAENNAAYALRILYTLGESMDMKSTLDGTPTRIDSPDKDAKVGFLQPADASGSFSLQLDVLEKNIMKSSFAVETPEIKSGSDMSSLTVKMLFADSYQKALVDAQHFQPFLDTAVELFKHGYAVESGRVSEFSAFNVKAEIFPYIFMSETEQVSNILQLRSSGALSRQTASELGYELGFGVNSEYQRILDEEHDELAGASGGDGGNSVNEFRNGGR